MAIGVKDRISALVELSKLISKDNKDLIGKINEARIRNPWFTEKSSWHMLYAIKENFLDQSKLETWVDDYTISEINSDDVLAIVMAGNIPLVGFHDFLCGYITGYNMELKLSEKDNVLLPYLMNELHKIDPTLNFLVVDRLTQYHKVIATGSTNTSMYFEQYFGHVPNIIRKNRTSIAVLDKDLSEADLKGLGNDLLLYFGLGCRNVSKIFLPIGMDIEIIFKSMKDHEDVAIHNKYMNNFDYSNALYLLNKEVVYSNGFLIAREAESLHSRISCVNYEFYTALDEVEEYINTNQESIQCVVSNIKMKTITSIEFGLTQQPNLAQYADNIDTMEFLLTSF